MERDDLLAMLREMEGGTLMVRPNGEIVGTEEGNEWQPDELEAAAVKLTAELARLVKWARLAPDYSSPGDPTNTGDLVDSEGIPY